MSGGTVEGNRKLGQRVVGLSRSGRVEVMMSQETNELTACGSAAQGDGAQSLGTGTVEPRPGKATGSTRRVLGQAPSG